MIFDDKGNVMTMCCCKEAENIYLSLDVFILSKNDDNTLSVQQVKDNMIIEMIQKQTKDISIKMEKIEIIPLFVGLVRDWEIGGDRIKKKHKVKSKDIQNSDNKVSDTKNIKNDKVASNEKNESDKMAQPPMKKRKLD